jgi:hypothetical protein
MSRLEQIIYICLGVAIVAYVWWNHSETTKRQEAAADKKRIVALAAKVPTSTTYNVEGGQIVVLDIPVPIKGVPTIGEVQRCFVWRDGAGSTMACPRPAEISID